VAAVTEQTPAALPATPPKANSRRSLIIVAVAVVAVAAAVIGVLLSRSGPAPGPDLSQCHEAQTEELSVQHLYPCAGSNVYPFASSNSRDQWRTIAESFGAVVLQAGPTWLRVKR